jgi:DnaK suppressor protein
MTEPLTDPQLKHLKSLLEAQRRELANEIRNSAAPPGSGKYSDIAGDVQDSGDESAAELLADLDAALSDRRVKELRATDRALQRIANGYYGVCANCGQAIGYERLRAFPHAARCFRCETASERPGSRGPPG